MTMPHGYLSVWTEVTPSCRFWTIHSSLDLSIAQQVFFSGDKMSQQGHTRLLKYLLGEGFIECKEILNVLFLCSDYVVILVR